MLSVSTESASVLRSMRLQSVTLRQCCSCSQQKSEDGQETHSLIREGIILKQRLSGLHRAVLVGTQTKHVMCSRPLKNGGEGGTKFLMVKIARPLDVLMVLPTKTLTVHCHLFVFGQESGDWLTCLCEGICFAEAALFDQRIVWDSGCGEKDIKKDFYGGCYVFY